MLVTSVSHPTEAAGALGALMISGKLGFLSLLLTADAKSSSSLSKRAITLQFIIKFRR